MRILHIHKSFAMLYNVYPKFMSTYTIFREPGIRAITQTGVAAVDVALLTTVGGGVSIAGDVRGQ